MSSLNKPGAMDASVLIRRLLFFVLLFGLVFFYLVLSFKGLTSAKGIDQAQIGREIARGNDATTKMIRPLAIWQAEENTENGEINLDQIYDTYHSPLYPYLLGAVIKAVGGDDFDKFQMIEDKRTIYRLDRVIAAVSVICFLVAIGINYLLISRIFDVRIAGVTALLMALCDLNWKFTHTGLPQMLMLLLFSCALFFIYRAVEASIDNRATIGSILLAAVFLALLALAHWLTLWISIGFVIYAALFFRPKGAAALSVIGVILVFSLYFVGKNLEWTGSPAGTAGMSLYGGLLETEDNIMRTNDPSEETYAVLYNLNSLILNTTTSLLRQADQLYSNLGAILAAPLFFFALLHPFKRESIAQFRWIILLMWFVGSIGMALFGLTDQSTDANQLHILFSPIMTAYGLAFFSILWSRLEFTGSGGLLRNVHFVIVILVSAGPLILTIPRSMQSGLVSDKQTRPVWPPYWPSILSRTLHDATGEEDIIFSDQPWAVAWYADRRSIWLPKKVSEFEYLEKIVEDQKLTSAGILMTPSSFKDNPLYKAGHFGGSEEFAALMLDGPSVGATAGGTRGLRSQAPMLSSVLTRYPESKHLFPFRLVYYSKKPIIDQQR
ncbi:glycosyltransferase family 39 protein [bacterium]|nr:glycosyltransferase family 39 protein [bacterium]